MYAEAKYFSLTSEVFTPISEVCKTIMMQELSIHYLSKFGLAP
jgi:hypothetical protein